MTHSTQHNKRHQDVPRTKPAQTPAMTQTILDGIHVDSPYNLGVDNSYLLRDTLRLIGSGGAGDLITVDVDQTAVTGSWHHTEADRATLVSDKYFNLVHYPGQELKVHNNGNTGFYVGIACPESNTKKFHLRGRIYVPPGSTVPVSI